MSKNTNEGSQTPLHELQDAERLVDPEYSGNEPRPEAGKPDHRRIQGERYPKTCKHAQSLRELKAYLDSSEVAKEKRIMIDGGRTVSSREIWASIEALVAKNGRREPFIETDFDTIPNGVEGDWADGLRDVVKRLFGVK